MTLGREWRDREARDDNDGWRWWRAAGREKEGIEHVVRERTVIEWARCVRGTATLLAHVRMCIFAIISVRMTRVSDPKFVISERHTGRAAIRDHVNQVTSTCRAKFHSRRGHLSAIIRKCEFTAPGQARSAREEFSSSNASPNSVKFAFTR